MYCFQLNEVVNWISKNILLVIQGSTTIIWMNKSKQEVSSEHLSIINRLYKFYNRNASSVRTIMVSKCLTPHTPTDAQTQECDNLQVFDEEVILIPL